MKKAIQIRISSVAGIFFTFEIEKAVDYLMNYIKPDDCQAAIDKLFESYKVMCIGSTISMLYSVGYDTYNLSRVSMLCEKV